MKWLKALLAETKAVRARGGSGTARQEADQEVERKSAQGMRTTNEMQAANEADFGRHSEEWHGKPPSPKTPREDPQHAAKARMGLMAERFLFALKIVFWVIFGPIYFAAIPWVAVIIALAISITLSLGVKPVIASGILKPLLTPHENERRLHANVIAGIIAFAISFGGLFLLRGLAGPFAQIGALFVLPVLSATDLVLLYLMGVAHARFQLYSWAAAFVRNHHEYSAYHGEFEHQYQAARTRLGKSEEKEIAPTVPAPSAAALPPPGGLAENGAKVAGLPQGTPPMQHVNGPVTVAMLALGMGLTFAATAHAQVMAPSAPSASQDRLADLQLDSTTSLYPGTANTITPMLVNSFYIWADQAGTRRLRVSTFERDGWLPRTIGQTAIKGTPKECISSHVSDRNIFRGISEALENQTNEACQRAIAAEANRIHAELTQALAVAWRAEPLAKRSCTAFNDTLAAAALAPAGYLVVIVSDTEETCKAETGAVPERGAGGNVIIILVPSKSDMGVGVSAAARFNAKKAHLVKIAPWLLAVLAPAEVEYYHLPVPGTPLMKVSSVQH